MGEKLRIAKMVSRANGAIGFYIDLITAEVLGILEEADQTGRKVPGKVVISNDYGRIEATVKVDANGCFYVPLKKQEIEALHVYHHYIGAFDVHYDRTL